MIRVSKEEVFDIAERYNVGLPQAKKMAMKEAALSALSNVDLAVEKENYKRAIIELREILMYILVHG